MWAAFNGDLDKVTTALKEPEVAVDGTDEVRVVRMALNFSKHPFSHLDIRTALRPSRLRLGEDILIL